MLPRPPSRAASACALALLALALPGCGSQAESSPAGRSSEAHREGLFVEAGDLHYRVLITRQLNPRDPGDRDYYSGPEAPAGSLLYGVFLDVCNQDDEPHLAARDFRVVDTRGTEFEPIEIEQEHSIYRYEPRELQPDECIPKADTAAASGPIAGSLLLFQFPAAAIENRPLALEIMPPASYGGVREELVEEIDLDL